MEFNNKLQELRKQKGITQEELAEALYVSRTAVSKWESGRGYPNIDSLKEISNFFNVSLDDLLSSKELLTIAEQDGKQKEKYFFSVLFGLIDISAALFLFLPLFGQKSNDIIESVSLLSLSGISFWIKAIFFILITVTVCFGVLTLVLQNCNHIFWLKAKTKTSLLLNGIGIFLFVISSQPYACIFSLVFFLIKVIILLKKQ